MNSNSIYIDRSENSTLARPAIPTTLFGRLRSWLVRSELQRAQAGYQLKKQRQQHSNNALHSLPLEQKQSLGMHRWMD